MKKQAICIQCHNKPEQINFLIEHLPQEHFDVFIHVDLKSTIADQILKRNNVYFCKRVNVQWGRFSQVEATLELLKMIQIHDYNYIHLISGNDCLIKPVNYILTLFSEENRKEYIESNILPGDSTWSWAGQDRYQCWYPQWLIKRPAYKTVRFLRVVYREFIMRTRIFKRKKYPVKAFWGGSAWFSITGKCAKWMLEYLEDHPEYIQFFKHGVCVDEVFFSTLVRQSPYAGNIVNDHLRFMIWDNTFSGGPKALEKSDIETMRKSKCVFARKVTDISVLESIENEFLESTE